MLLPVLNCSFLQRHVTCVFLPGTGWSVNLTVPAWDWTCVKLTMPMTGTYIDLTMGTCDALSILA
jgi:hypothetical protein